MILRFPKQATLPFGWHIRVVLVSDDEMLSAYQGKCTKCRTCSACRSAERDDLDDGLWQVADPKTIYIRRACSATRRRYMLSHELGHAFHDWQHYFLNRGDMKP